MYTLTEKLNQTPEDIKLYQRVCAIFEATELICQAMDRMDVNKADLAKRMGKTKGYITQLLNGANMTISTLSDVFVALGRSIHFFDCTLSPSDPVPPVLTMPVDMRIEWPQNCASGWPKDAFKIESVSAEIADVHSVSA